MRLIFPILLALIASVVHASGDAEAGKAQSSVCAGCHGPNGMSMIPTYPNLAGQNEAYLLEALKAYKAGNRKGGNAGIMAPMAAGLSDQAMKDLAAYYASLEAKKQ